MGHVWPYSMPFSFLETQTHKTTYFGQFVVEVGKGYP